MMGISNSAWKYIIIICSIYKLGIIAGHYLLCVISMCVVCVCVWGGGFNIRYVCNLFMYQDHVSTSVVEFYGDEF